MSKFFKHCEICGANDWKLVYSGNIRDGKFGSFKDGCLVGLCLKCHSCRLAEKDCLEDKKYEDETYRKKLDNGLDVNDYFVDHDKQIIFTLNSICPITVRNKIIMDVGCGGGSLLDSLKGLTKKQIAIEPYNNYYNSLKKRDIEVFRNLKEAHGNFQEQIDIAFAIQVLEHTSNPIKFLKDIFKLLKKNGILILSTPNRDDILMEALPDIYPSFFYRVVHRWYFNAKSLVFCAKKSGFKLNEIKYVHRYGFANFINWLKLNKPTGNENLPFLNKLANDFWKGYLEQNGKSDCLYIILSKK